MKSTELAELFLTKLYDLAESNGFNKFHSLDEIAKEFGVNDGGKVMQTAKYLGSQGLVSQVISSGGTDAMITGNGAVFVEKGGETGIIPRYRQNPAAFVVHIDNMTTIHGDVSNSNVTSHSSGVSQRVNVTPGVDSKLTEIVATLQKDTSLTKEDLSDALTDIETIKLQASKKKKDKPLLQSCLGGLGKIASVAKPVAELGIAIFGHAQP